MTNSLQSLLNRDLPLDYLREATQHVAAEPSTVVATTESAMVFRIHTEWLALSTMVFQGIAHVRAVHTLPHRRNGVLLGVTPVRGALLACVSLGALLGVASAVGAAGQGEGRMMIVKGAGGLLVFPVDEVHGIYRYRPEELHEVPATLAHAETRYTLGMLPWNDRWVARLDDALVFHAVSRALS